MPGSQLLRDALAAPVAGAEDNAQAAQTGPRRLLHLTTLRVPLSFGVSIAGRGIVGRRIGLYDYWFEPDDLDEPAVFRRAEDGERLVRVLFPERLEGSGPKISGSFSNPPDGFTPPAPR